MSPHSLILGMGLLASTARADYSPSSLGWNGLGTLVDEAQKAGCPVTTPSVLDFSRLGKHDVLWLIYPTVAIDAGALKRWLASGGRAVLADDFGALDGAFEALEIARVQSSPRRGGYQDNPMLPIARRYLGTELGHAAKELVANHPSLLASKLPATYGFAPNEALVIEGLIGSGYFVAIGDPSLFINNMLELDGNLAFARGLVARTCRSGDDRILLFTQSFETRTEPPRDESPWKRFNQMLSERNGDLKSGATDPRALTSVALMLAVAALFVIGGAFPSRGSIDHHWGRVRQLLSRREDPLFSDDAASALKLRDEAVERLTEALGQNAAKLGPAAVAKLVTQRWGILPGRRAEQLWRALGERGIVTRRRLHKLHEMATALFEDIK